MDRTADGSARHRVGLRRTRGRHRARGRVVPVEGSKRQECRFSEWPEISPFYRTWFCWPIGSLPAASTDPSPYDPAVCGWTLTVAKLVGSAFVIAPVEEVFFRSFLYRWLQKRDFLSIPLARFNLSAFLWMVFLFTLEHDRPLAAALAGAVYGFAAIRWGLTSAIIAHVTTNLLLALHVIFSGAWAFW